VRRSDGFRENDAVTSTARTRPKPGEHPSCQTGFGRRRSADPEDIDGSNVGANHRNRSHRLVQVMKRRSNEMS
jgi:hypothetical protein